MYDVYMLIILWCLKLSVIGLTDWRTVKHDDIISWRIYKEQALIYTNDQLCGLIKRSPTLNANSEDFLKLC